MMAHLGQLVFMDSEKKGWRVSHWGNVVVVLALSVAGLGYWYKRCHRECQRGDLREIPRARAGTELTPPAETSTAPVTQIYVEQLCLSKEGRSREQIAKQMQTLYTQHGVDEATYTTSVRERLKDLEWSRTVSRRVHQRCPGPARRADE